MNKRINQISLLLLIIGLISLFYRLSIPEQISPEGYVYDNLGYIVISIWTLSTSFVLFIFNILKSIHHKNKTSQ